MIVEIYSYFGVVELYCGVVFKDSRSLRCGRKFKGQV